MPSTRKSPSVPTADRRHQHGDAPSILVVDDDKDDHAFLAMALGQVMPDAQITSFYDGSEVKDFLLHKHEGLAAGRRPDLIFLDINMSVVGGRETTYILKKDEEFASIPLVILTTGSDPAEREEMLRLGADAFYTKPVDINVLVKIVKEVQARFLR